MVLVRELDRLCVGERGRRSAIRCCDGHVDCPATSGAGSRDLGIANYYHIACRCPAE